MAFIGQDLRLIPAAIRHVRRIMAGETILALAIIVVLFRSHCSVCWGWLAWSSWPSSAKPDRKLPLLIDHLSRTTTITTVDLGQGGAGRLQGVA